MILNEIKSIDNWDISIKKKITNKNELEITDNIVKMEYSFL